MPNLKEMRKELWDYLAAQGFVLSTDQHEKIKRIIEDYVATASEIRKDSYTQAMKELEVARQGFKAWKKEKAERGREKAKRKREAQEAKS